MLTIIIYYVLALTSYYMLVLVFGKLLQQRFKYKLVNLGLIALFAISNDATSYDDLLIIKSSVSILTFVTICIFIYKCDIKKTSSTTITFLIVTIITEMIIMVLMPAFKKIDINYVTGTGLLKASLTLISMIVSYLLLLIDVVKTAAYKCIDFFESIYKYTKYIIVFLTTIIVIFMFYVVNYSDKSSAFMNIIFILSCVVIIFLVFNSINKNNKLNLFNELLTKNEIIYQKQLENYKTFKHNIIHEFNCIRSVGNKKVNDLIDEYLVEHKSPNESNIDLGTAPKGIRTIIYGAILSSGDYKNRVSVDSYLHDDPLDYLSVKKYCRLSECMGIIINNAIEESKNVDDYFVYILLREDENNLYVSVCNKFMGSKEVDLIGVKEITKKENHMGIGIKYINNYSGFDSKILIRNNTFNISLTIKK